MRFHCKICDNTFKKFVLFEGHFELNVKCREKHSCFLQCYLCSQEFRHSAGLKYHLQQHTASYAYKIPEVQPIRKVPKITLKKQWNFKIVPQVTEEESYEVVKDHRLECKICRKKYRSFFYLQQHLLLHQKKRLLKSRRTNESGKSTYVASVPNVPTRSTVASNESPKKIPELFPKRFQCSICKIKMRHGGERLARHIQLHTTGKFECKICNIKFSKVSLSWHKKRFHRGIESGQHSRGRECTICKATFSSHCSLKRHQILHEIGETKCELCNIRFTHNALLIHQAKFHPDLPRVLSKQPCEICKYFCYTRADIAAHAEMHRDGEFQCDRCQIKFTSDALQWHNKRQHHDPIAKVMCSICKIKLSKPSYLEQHMKVHIIGDVRCEICDIRFTRNSLMYHHRIFHPNLNFRVPDPLRTMRKGQFQKQKRERQRLRKIADSLQFQCKLCKLLCGDAKRLDRHMNVHTAGDAECRICKVSFTKNSLMYHEKRFHPEVVQKERILKALQRHISDELNTLNESDLHEIPIILEDQYKQLLAENKLKSQCIICKLPCGDARKLDTHTKVHIEGEYKCEICKVWFTKNSLDFHQRRYHSEYYEERVLHGIKLIKEHGEDGQENEFSEKKSPFLQCDICKVRTVSRDEMAKHKRVHIIGEVKCELCQIRFSNQSLRYHLKRFHPEIPQKSVQLQCEICKLKFSDAKRLETHMTVHTEGDAKCDICNIPFTKQALLIHERRHHGHSHTRLLIERAIERNMSAEGATNHRRASVESNGQPFQCVICKIDCGTNRKKFDAHLKLHVDGDVKCQVCQIWFTKPSLDYHYKRFHPELHITKEQCNAMQCDVCTLICYDESRLKEHMKVHLGNIKCDICNIGFTKAALVYHYKRFHPNIPKKDRILKAIENCAAKKSLHSCNRCGKSFTRICYLKLHMKAHRNGTEQLEIPFEFPAPPSNNDSDSEHSLTCQRDCMTNARNCSYECYVCKETFPISSRLQKHLSKHVLFQQWVDPLNIHLSNWNPEVSREIILNQPLVLVENLNVNNINLKSLTDFGASTNQNGIAEVQLRNGSLAETDLPTITVSNDSQQPDTTQMDCDEIYEILSESDEDCETIRKQLNNNAWLRMKQEPSSTQFCTDADGSVYISSDDDDVTESFHCYFCNGRFGALSELGAHEKLCYLKCEPAF